MARYTATVRDPNEAPVPGAFVAVSDYKGALANLTDDSGNPLPNPFHADELGGIAINAVDGQYNFDYHYPSGHLIRRDYGVVIGTIFAAVNPSPENAGKYIALDANGNPTPASGTGNDPALRTDLAAPTGAQNIGFKQTGEAIDEDALTVLRREVWAESYGVSASNTGAQNAAAFQKAIAVAAATGCPLRFRGDYTTDTILLPPKPAIIRVKGSGSLTQGTPNKPIIAAQFDADWPAVAVRVFNARLSGFRVIPHAGSSRSDTSNVLVDISAFESSQIDLEYEDNPSSTASTGVAYAAIGAHAQNAPTYKNFIRLILLEGAKSSRGVWLHNNDTGDPNFNPNENVIEVRGYSTACDYIVDCLNTTQTTIRNSLFESGNGSVRGILAGNYTLTERNWFEALSVAIEYSVAPGTVANNCISSGDQFSGSNLIVIANEVAAPPRFDNPLPGAVSFADENGNPTANYIAPTVAVAQPEPPSVSFTSGGGTITPDAGGVRLRVDHHGVTTFALRVFVTPTATGNATMRLAPPSGFEFEQAVIGVKDSGGTRLAWGLGNDIQGRDFEWTWPNTSDHTINIRGTMRRLA